MDYITTVFSTRIYDNEIKKIDIDNIIQFQKDFSRAKYSSYNLTFFKELNKTGFEDKYGDKSLFLILKDKYPSLNTYFLNSALNLGKGAFKSQNTRFKDYIVMLKDKVKLTVEKINKEKEKLNNYVKTRDNYYVFLKDNIKFKAKGIKNISYDEESHLFYVRYNKGKNFKTYGKHEFLYKYLNPKINKLKSKTGRLKYKLNNLNKKIENKCMKHIIFCNGDLGSKYNNFDISGRKDSINRNFVFKANIIGDTFDFNIFLPNKRNINLKVKFPFRGEDIKEAIQTENPINYALIRKYDTFKKKYYFQIKCSFNLGSIYKTNYHKDNGVVATDFNYNHIDLTELDDKGNLINSETIYYKITNDSRKNELYLREALEKVAKYCHDKNKPWIMEDLDTSRSKNKSDYRDKSLNKIFHTLAYSKYKEIAKYKALINNVELFLVKPNFTSIIGLLKYSNDKKINTHISASFVIGRRGMGYKEKINKKYHKYIKDLRQNEWKKWSILNRENNKLKKSKKVFGLKVLI